jgi:hypothetical protein
MHAIIKITLLVFISAIGLSNSAFSQKKLDLKRGFKNFIIGDNKSKYDGHLQFNKATNQGIVFYKYLPGEDANDISLSDYKFNFVHLAFDKKNKLVGISLVKEYDMNSYVKGTEDLVQINKQLINMYGTFTREYEDQKTLTIGTLWVGKCLVLGCTNTPMGSDLGSETQILIRKYK